MTESRLQTLIKSRNVVFITVKNIDYIRVRQIERICRENAASVKTISSEKGNPLSRAIDIKMKLTTMQYFKKKGIFAACDVLILGFLPQLIWEKTVAIAKRFNPNVIVISDFFLSIYDTVALDRKYVSEKGIIAKCLKKLDKRALTGADLVLTDTKADADFFSKEFEVDREKFEVLYLEADKDIYFSSEEENIDNKNGTIYVLYFGTGLPLQGTDIVLEAFNIVTKVSSIRCIYVGSVKRIPKDIVRKAKSNNRIEIIKWLPQDKLNDMIKQSDICLAGHFNANIDKADRTIPGKALIYERLKKNIILGDTKANHEIFKEDNKHSFVKRGSAREVAEQILKISVVI